MLSWLTSALSPAPHVKLLPEEEVQRAYPRLRWAVFESTFIGYAAFYLVRNNFSPVAKDIGQAFHYSPDDIGNILAVTAITYGLGKLFMGAVSDRSNPRKFMALGLVLTAVLNVAFGCVGSFWLHFLLWGLNGFVQGMGWAPCGRSIGHWYSARERGWVFAWWNIAHNVGGGLAGVVAAQSASRWGWRYAFHVPAVLAVITAVYVFFRLEDTPQSVGLPPVEEYKSDWPESGKATHEAELSYRELMFDHVLCNRVLWLFALANLFVYIARYAMLDWGPMYLRQVKWAFLPEDRGLELGGFALSAIEFGGIPSTILMGWVSDRMGGRRGLVSLMCMGPVFLAFLGLMMVPPGHVWTDFALLTAVGLFVYPPVMLLGVSALDQTSKKAVGAAAGFVGLFGYIGRSAQAKGFGWMLNRYGPVLGMKAAWHMVFVSILICTALSIVLLAFTRNVKPRA